MTRPKITWTEEEVRELGVRTDVPTAGEIVAGWSRDDSYRAVKRGDFPVPVVRCGRRLIVPVAPILRLLGMDAGPAGAASGEDIPAAPDPLALQSMDTEETRCRPRAVLPQARAVPPARQRIADKEAISPTSAA